LFWYILIFCAIAIAAVIAIYDVVQTRYPILRNFPLVGHGRAVLEKLGPKLRQYIIASNNEERPFSRTSASGSTLRPMERITILGLAPTMIWNAHRGM